MAVGLSRLPQTPALPGRGDGPIVSGNGDNGDETDVNRPPIWWHDPGDIDETGDDYRFAPPARTHFLLAGLDEEPGQPARTDALMAGVFYRETGEIRLMSIPRDTFTHLPPARLEQMRARGLNPPSMMRINELRAFGGSQHGPYFLTAQLGEMLGIYFRYYVEVTLPAFRRLVDIIGGVYIEIPIHLQYHDPDRDLTIDVPAGRHRANGAMAEGLVRFRGYNLFPNDDFGRNAVHMQFMTQVLRQMLSREAIMGDPLALVRTVLSEVSTNFGLNSARRYLPYIERITSDRISTHTLPGGVGYVHGRSYFMPDAARLPGFIREVFFDEPYRIVVAPPQTDRALQIQVLNGSHIAGLGQSTADWLELKGHTITNVDIFTGQQEARTRIWVREQAHGLYLQPVFNNAAIQLRQDIPAYVDVVIIMGRNDI